MRSCIRPNLALLGVGAENPQMIFKTLSSEAYPLEVPFGSPPRCLSSMSIAESLTLRNLECGHRDLTQIAGTTVDSAKWLITAQHSIIQSLVLILFVV